MSTSTVSADDLEVVNLEGAPSLVRVMRCTHPLERSVRVPLDGVNLVELGRGELAITRDGDKVKLGVPDERMSSAHCKWTRDGRRFFLADLGSKNGTLVNGRRIETKELADGDVIEAGQTFFVYRARNPREIAATPTWLAESSGGELPLTTFVPALARQYQALAAVAKSTVPVVVLGETGTGKEVVARAVHRMSDRTGPFVAINCGAIPGNLIESELFGAKKGAFSGATEDRQGLVRSADGGTLFLDEIGELPPTAQIALLRVLQEHEVMPIGATRPVKVDVRIVAATHRPLDRLVDSASFRADLFARLGGLTIRLPALRERREDLGLIIGGLVKRIAKKPDDVKFSHAVGRVLFSYPFPRNIRELEKTLGLAVTIATSTAAPLVDIEHLPDELRAPNELRPATTPEIDEDEERKAHIIALLVQHQGRVADVARAMGKARMQIHRWIQRYGIDLESYRK
ncbi:MAG: sigma 54-interacting transcriptional regulator [Deltaproteobacteria bacterium]|nr:sigma 54-interacting transcriptional regulator [Deltaproteobacteria bacterium]